MKNVNIHKVTTLLKMGLSEQKGSLIWPPFAVGLLILLNALLFNSNWEGRVNDTIKFTGILAGVFPILNSFNIYLNGAFENTTLALPMTRLEKYVGFVAASFVGASIWLLLSGLSGTLGLLFVGYLNSIAPLQVIQDIASSIQLYKLVICLFLGTLFILVLIAVHTQKRYRKKSFSAPITLFLLIFVPAILKILFPELIQTESKNAILSVYIALLTIGSVCWGYRIFKYIETANHR